VRNNNVDVEDRNLIQGSRRSRVCTTLKRPLPCLQEDKKKEEEPQTTVLCGYLMSKRKAGILGAVFNGLMTGVPHSLHYPKGRV
jgi:hypothetical protein